MLRHGRRLAGLLACAALAAACNSGPLGAWRGTFTTPAPAGGRVEVTAGAGDTLAIGVETTDTTETLTVRCHVHATRRPDAMGYVVTTQSDRGCQVRRPGNETLANVNVQGGEVREERDLEGNLRLRLSVRGAAENAGGGYAMGDPVEVIFSGQR